MSTRKKVSTGIDPRMLINHKPKAILQVHPAARAEIKEITDYAYLRLASRLIPLAGRTLGRPAELDKIVNDNLVKVLRRLRRAVKRESGAYSQIHTGFVLGWIDAEIERRKP